MRARIFLLSPASCAGSRARMLLSTSARSPLAERLRSDGGAPLGDVFAFISQLYFRGKLAYAQSFARVPRAEPRRSAKRGGGTRAPRETSDAEDVLDGVRVITTSRGLVRPDIPVNVETLREFAAVDLRLANVAYTRPLEASARSLAERLAPEDEVVLLGSIASDKYVGVLEHAFGDRLRFPGEFVGRGDMSRGGLMLRCVDEGRELKYIALAGAVRHGARPPRLERRGAGARPREGGGDGSASG